MSKPKKIKKLLKLNKNTSSRNFSGKITVRGRGGRHKRFLRLIDFKRDKVAIPARVSSIEYDPNRTALIALITYQDGHKSYILAPDSLKVGTVIVSDQATDIKPGNSCLLKNIPVGTPIHCLEIRPGKGAQLVRSAGTQALIQAKDGNDIQVKMPSGEIRLFSGFCRATIGSLTNADHKNIKLGKAGRRRHLGFRPKVRGVAQNPRSHPHGGGEGRSGIGMPSPKSPWGKKTLGKKTRKKKKYSNKFIIKDRRSKR